MKQYINMNGSELEKYTQTLGLTPEDLDNIFQKTMADERQYNEITGPRPYGCGGYYGTISINNI